MDPEPLARPASGYGRSGLTDDERSLLVYVTLRHVAAELGLSLQDAADLLRPPAARPAPVALGRRPSVARRAPRGRVVGRG